MSLILNGVPEPRIVLSKSGVVVDDFTLSGFQSGPSAPVYLQFSPDVLRHPLDTFETRTKLRGFEMRMELYWPQIPGSQMRMLGKILDRRAYDKCELYPWKTDKPHFSEVMSIDSDDINLAYFFLLQQQDFTLKLISSRLVDYVPLADADFLSWGNITLQFTDLTTQYSSLT